MDKPSYFIAEPARTVAGHGLDFFHASSRNYSFPRHFHETFLVQLVRSGTDSFYCRRDSYSAAPGNLVLIEKAFLILPRLGKNFPGPCEIEHFDRFMDEDGHVLFGPLRLSVGLAGRKAIAKRKDKDQWSMKMMESHKIRFGDR